MKKLFLIICDVILLVFLRNKGVLASYPNYDLNAHDAKEEVELAFGQIFKIEMVEIAFATAHYTSFEWSLGGAILSNMGKVNSMHAKNYGLFSFATLWDFIEFHGSN